MMSKPSRKSSNEFHPWRVDTSTLLNYMERSNVDKNHYLVLQGDPSKELFFIESGKVKVIVELDNGRTMRVRTMGAGTVVGEIGLYLVRNGSPRSRPMSRDDLPAQRGSAI